MSSTVHLLGNFIYITAMNQCADKLEQFGRKESALETLTKKIDSVKNRSLKDNDAASIPRFEKFTAVIARMEAFSSYLQKICEVFAQTGVSTQMSNEISSNKAKVDQMIINMKKNMTLCSGLEQPTNSKKRLIQTYETTTTRTSSLKQQDEDEFVMIDAESSSSSESSDCSDSTSSTTTTEIRTERRNSLNGRVETTSNNNILAPIPLPVPVPHLPVDPPQIPQERTCALCFSFSRPRVV
jgi:hypothetical protein